MLIFITVIDLTILYPPTLTALLPSISKTLLEHQEQNYQDLFFISPPRWFIFYIWLELCFHVPVSIWSLYGLWNGMLLNSATFISLSHPHYAMSQPYFKAVFAVIVETE